MDKMLLLSEIFPPTHGGSGRWFWEIYTRLDHANIVIVAGMHADASSFDISSPLTTYRINMGTDAWGISSLKGIIFYLKLFRKLKKILKKEKVERLHCGRCLPEGVVAYLLNKFLGIKYICYVHGEDIETAATSRELSWMVRKVLNAAEFLVANSQNTASLLKNNWAVKSANIKVVHPGVDAQKFVPATEDENVKKTLGWNSRNVVLTVGRLQARKGHDMMIRALPDIKASIPDVMYIIVGDGEEKDRLTELVKSMNISDNVLFMSEISDEQMIQCYQQCNLFILPNRTIGRDIEGFGIVLVEAQACGKPVIAGDSGGTIETMIVDKTGYIVDCTDPLQISDKVKKILLDSELQKNMGMSGREHVLAQLDWEGLSKKMRTLFDGLD